MWASKTLGLVVMEIKVKGFFLTILSFDVVTDRLFHSPKRVEMGYAWNAWKTTITRYVIRAFMKKEWLKAAKIISSKWIFWKFVSEMGTNPSPTSPPKLLCRSHPCWFHFTSFWIICVFQPNEKQMSLIYRHFCPHLIRCSVQDLYLNKVILPWSDYIFVFNEMGTEKPRIRKPRNTLCKQLMIKRRRCIIQPSYIAFIWTIEEL